jgi:predicted nucleic acid-binding protein
VSFLLDTNVVSERIKPRPNTNVIGWFDSVNMREAFISVITLAELRRGVERMADGSRRRAIERWLQSELMRRFHGRIIAVDERIANMWGEVVAERDGMGRPMAAMDAFIAATARVHGLTLVTRDIADFAGSVPSLLDPWRTEPNAPRS